MDFVFGKLTFYPILLLEVGRSWRHMLLYLFSHSLSQHRHHGSRSKRFELSGLLPRLGDFTLLPQQNVGFLDAAPLLM